MSSDAQARPIASAGMSSRGYHRLAMYEECPQAYSYRFNLHLEPAHLADPLALGSMIHIGLMHHYLRRMGVAVDEPVEAMRVQPARIAHQFSRAKEIVESYIRRYTGETLQPLDVEREFRVLAHGQLHTQRADLVGKLGGKVVVIDHKTQARVTTTSAREWENSGQMIGYELIGRHLLEKLYGLPWGGVIVNFVKTTPPFDAQDSFRRVPLQVPLGMIGAFPQMVREVNDQIDAASVEGRDPWKYRRSFSCYGRYGACSYLRLCQQGKSASGEYVAAIDKATEVRDGAR